MSVIYPKKRFIHQITPMGISSSIATTYRPFYWITSTNQVGFPNIFLNPYPDRNVRAVSMQIQLDDDATDTSDVTVELSRNGVVVLEERFDVTTDFTSTWFKFPNKVVFEPKDVLTGQIKRNNGTNGNEPGLRLVIEIPVDDLQYARLYDFAPIAACNGVSNSYRVMNFFTGNNQVDDFNKVFLSAHPTRAAYLMGFEFGWDADSAQTSGTVQILRNDVVVQTQELEGVVEVMQKYYFTPVKFDVGDLLSFNCKLGNAGANEVQLFPIISYNP